MKSKIAGLILFMVLAGWLGGASAGELVIPKSGAIQGRYIVVLDSRFLPEPAGAENAKALEERAGEASRLARVVSARHRVPAKEVWGPLGMFLVETTERAARRLANDPRVARVEQDARMELSAVPNCFTGSSFPLANSYNPVSPQTISCWDPQLNCTDNWGLDRIDQRTGSQSAHTLDGKFYFGATGLGVHIYIVDTGLVTHTEFANSSGGSRIGAGTNVSSDRPAWDYYDGSGHGTLVASVAAGRRFGVAKAATIHPVRISPDSGASSVALACSGLNWVILNLQRPAVVNLSYNFRKFGQDTTALDQAVDRLITGYGVPLVNSAGNWNQDANGFSPTGLTQVTVAAGMDWVNNQRWGADPVSGCHTNGCGSNWGTTVDLYAPAADILGAVASVEANLACEGTGTSFAAPLVTGVVAQYLQGNPTASPATIESVLTSQATAGVIQGNLQFSPNLLLFTNF